jgi:hypothetical protein
MDDLITRAENMTTGDTRHFYTTDALDLMREMIVELRKVMAERDAMLRAVHDNHVADCRAEAAEAEVARLTAELATQREALFEADGMLSTADHTIAALVAELDAARGRVKPLVWIPNTDYRADGVIAGGFDGWWTCHRSDVADTFEYSNPWGKTSVGFTSIEAAKSAAQADYTARILAALEPDPAVERMRKARAAWQAFKDAHTVTQHWASVDALDAALQEE